MKFHASSTQQFLAPALIMIGLAGCRSLPRGAEGVTLDGRPLMPAELPESRRATLTGSLEKAADAYRADPRSVEVIAQYGKRLSAMSKFNAAIDIYSNGLAIHADSPVLLRLRGHRYISIRQFERARADLERAARLILGRADEPELNAEGKPSGTLHHAIYYHLGLAHYLLGNYRHAADAYRSCLSVSHDAESIVSTSHWYWMTLKRMGHENEAATLLEPVRRGVTVEENIAYLRCLQLYAGLIDTAAALQGSGSSGAAAAYGVGNFLRARGDKGRGNAVLQQLLAGPEMFSFGYIAAEVDLVRDGTLQQR